MDAGCCNLQDAIILVRLWLQIWRGIPSAFGVLNYTNSDSYEGEFKNGTRHGNGKMLWDDGEYEGEWEGSSRWQGHSPNFFLSHGTKEKKGSKKLMDLYRGCCRARITKVTGRMAGNRWPYIPPSPDPFLAKHAAVEWNDGKKLWVQMMANKVGEPCSGDLYGKT